MEIKEMKRLDRVIDMMRTMHSIMRDRYKYISLLVDLTILSVSVILCATVFIDPEILKKLGIDTNFSKILLGISSILIFLLSLFQLKVNWKQKIESYERSVEILCNLKNECNISLNPSEPINKEEIQIQYKKIGETLATLPKIPDRYFPKLKAKHKRKIELSKLIDKRLESPYWLTKLFFEFKSIFKKYNENSQNKKED
jgi:hypothetical protein